MNGNILAKLLLKPLALDAYYVCILVINKLEKYGIAPLICTYLKNEILKKNPNLEYVLRLETIEEQLNHMIYQTLIGMCFIHNRVLIICFCVFIIMLSTKLGLYSYGIQGHNELALLFNLVLITFTLSNFIIALARSVVDDQCSTIKCLRYNLIGFPTFGIEPIMNNENLMKSLEKGLHKHNNTKVENII